MSEQSFTDGDEKRQRGWRLNGVPLNGLTVLLAIAILAGTTLAAGLSYRLLGRGTTDMTLPPRQSFPNQGGEVPEPTMPADLPR